MRRGDKTGPNPGANPGISWAGDVRHRHRRALTGGRQAEGRPSGARIDVVSVVFCCARSTEGAGQGALISAAVHIKTRPKVPSLLESSLGLLGWGLDLRCGMLENWQIGTRVQGARKPRAAG